MDFEVSQNDTPKPGSVYLDRPRCYFTHKYLKIVLCVCEQIRKTQVEPQWIVAQRLLSALTIPGFT